MEGDGALRERTWKTKGRVNVTDVAIVAHWRLVRKIPEFVGTPNYHRYQSRKRSGFSGVEGATA
jgi:hypothetical protein